jgi:outer membrane protein TolC
MLYRSGMATYLEIITANNNLLQSELDKIAIKRDKFNAITDLYRSLGGGVE